MPRIHPRARLFAFAVLLVPATLPAQAVSGTVTDPQTRAGVPNAVVVLVDSMGRRREAVLSDAQGRYALQAPSPGTWRVSAERVGYSTGSSPPLALAAGQQVTHSLTISVARLVLDPVTARGRPRACTVRPRNGEQAARVWDEARKALEAAELGARRRRYVFHLRYFRRTLTVPGRTVTDSVSWTESGASSQPFRTPVERLVAHGYVEAEGDSIVYRAPDASTLLSDAFLDYHCFSLRRGEGRTAGLVGLDFAPLRGRRVPDVRGTLWLEGRTGHLRHVEYSYTGLPYADRSDVGGRIDFAQVGDGGWIVSRWTIRMPILATRFRSPDPFLTALVEAGGEVTDIRTAP